MRIAVPRNRETYAFDTFDEAVQWLIELRDRLRSLCQTSRPDGAKESRVTPSRPADSDPNYTVHCEEPDFGHCAPALSPRRRRAS